MYCAVQAKRWTRIALTSALLCAQAAAEPDHHHHDDHAAPDAAVDAACAVALAPEPAAAAEVARLNTLKHRISHAPRRSEASASSLWLETLAWEMLGRAQSSLRIADLSLLANATRCLESRQPGSPAAAFFNAYVLYSQHQFDEAEQLLGMVVEVRGLPLDWTLLGDARLEQGRVDDAARAYERLLDMKPGPAAYVRLALIREQRGDLDGARAALALAANAVRGVHDTQSAWIGTHHARLSYLLGDLDTAEAELETILARRPDYVPAWYQAGKVALAAGWHEAAEVRLREAVAREPSPEHQWALIEALSANGKTAEADDLANTLTSTGAYFDALTTALFLSTNGIELDTAEALLTHELGDRRDVRTLDGMAWTLYQLGDLQRSWAFAQQALAHGSVTSRVRAHAAVIARAVGEDAAAVEHARVARRSEHTLYPSERALAGSH